jgi:transcriptional regulator with XRE-family HTH domain
VQPTPLQPRDADSATFPQLLRIWRSRRRLSQLELALESGVSQRHLSFLESGRSRPSRAMILELTETLSVPLRDRNTWLLAAGFAPVFRSLPLDDPQMAQVMSAVHRMLANHEPFPAIAIDRAWNIRLWTRVGGEQRNIMRLFFHPDGIRPLVVNWAAIAPLLWHRVQREAEALGAREGNEILAELDRYVDSESLRVAEDTALLPVLPVVLEKDWLRVSLFTVIATFGTPQDVTADELRVESLFPADEATERLFRGA